MSFERLAPLQHDTIDEVPAPSENQFLVGHDDVRASLAGAYRQGKLHHALLLAGPEGIGKATLAFHLANHLLLHRDPASAPETIDTPDPASQLFRAIAQGAHPSVLHLTRPAREGAKGFKTVLTVDEIRKVSRFLSMSAHDGGYRVVIVDTADDMNVSAANALLKNLEEPPRKTVFMLIAHQPGRLLATIRSRCRIVRMGALADDELLSALDAVGAELPTGEEERALLARRASGSVRAALMLTQYGGLEIAGAIDTVLGAARFDMGQAVRLAEAVTQRDQPMQFQLFGDHLLDLLSSRAEGAAEAGHAGKASRLADLWSVTRAGLRELETYNLDKRQHVLGALQSLHADLARL